MTTFKQQTIKEKETKRKYCIKGTTANLTQTHPNGPVCVNRGEEVANTTTLLDSGGGINKKSLLQNLLSKCKTTFQQSFTNANITLKDEKWLKNVRTAYFVCDHDGSVELAYLPNVLPKELVEEFTEKFESIQTGRKKDTGYSGILDNSMPFNYVTADLSQELGQYLSEIVNPQINYYISKLLTCVSSRTINYLVSLNDSYYALNNCLYPSTAFNSLKPSNDGHRIRKPHKDNLDITPSSLFYFGNFQNTEGYLELTDKNCKVFVQPGDVLFFKGNEYKHVVANITSGWRIGLVYFAHKGSKTKPYYEDTQKNSLKIHKETK
ncbi:predicted protein [Naegleria gruberi]|uniref:Tet-like dioxygenase 1 n=1 Tax=Naegleria gruberi TaxID=5762 RepID=TET1_NAEGR|nr:uncharacterized protein NAEGRDRAFT_55029 [Naegleria gruberi]D2W6T1.1 RecName: Full=Tet-like dioxygenase 1; AltName: Full=NgTet1 [Naegleria gruberi]EFC35221.1 predicted protein [Naegleria gruberi]|eukprot:XP_002667965.1 predicted protein [Naegleria gruberi strain NEG-M]